MCHFLQQYIYVCQLIHAGLELNMHGHFFFRSAHLMLQGLANSETAAYFVSFSFFIIVVFVFTFRHSFQLLIAVVFVVIGLLVIYYGFLLLSRLFIPSLRLLPQLMVFQSYFYLHIHFGILVGHFGFSFPLTHSLLSTHPVISLLLIYFSLRSHNRLLVITKNCGSPYKTFH